MMIKRITTTFCLAAVMTNADPITSDTMFERIGIQSGVDPLLLYSIAIVESATGTGDGETITPHPYVFRTSDGPQFFHARDEAEQALEKALETTDNIDVGMMQRNLYWHPPQDGEALFDPEEQVTWASELLASYLSRDEPLELRIGRYHSSRHPLAIAYGQRVLKVYSNLMKLEDITHADQ
ncbi:hypothetical protein [uncultured Umboniibacter sp.]|uniref:hypothetical protein n=1 Tax=uncultured Umboniibacter sp. TaxID=1798917 RepID=UPI00261EEAE9|nr:hypothetical protein [uncultured Umboniibacter sp.]